MFSRVVSNFRRKSKSSRKLMKSSVSSPEIKISPCENNCGRKLASKFNSDEALSATLSIIDNDNEQRQTKSVSLEVDYQRESDSGADF